jgi:lysophospholipase L1-like esterase
MTNFARSFSKSFTSEFARDFHDSGIITSPIRVVVFGDSITGATSTNSTDNGTAYNVTGITRAASAVVTENGSISTTAGDTMYTHSNKGIVEINNRQAVASAGSATTATLPIDSSAFTAWTADGKIYRRNNAVISNLAQGAFTACNAIMGQRFIFTHENNRGIGGDTTTTLNARKAISLAGNGFQDTYGLVIYMAGTNDIGTTVTTPASLATMQANDLAIIDYVTNTLGKIIVLGDVPPVTANDATQIQRRRDLNAWRDTLASSKVIRWKYWDDVANPDGTCKTGLFYDDVHFNPKGGHIAGRVMAIALRQRYGNGEGFRLRSTNLLTNPFFTGTGGTLSGVGATNNGIATGWTIETSGTGAAGTKVLSKDADGYQDSTVNYGSGLSTGERVSPRQDVLAASLVVGQYYTCEALIRIPAGSGQWYDASLELRNQSTGRAFDYARRNDDPLAIAEIIQDGGWLHLKTQPSMFLATDTLLRPRINMTHKCDLLAGSGTMKLAACQLYPSEYS